MGALLENKAVLPDPEPLAQNYPNPFNPATTIRYELRNSGSVSLSIYDMSGQRIRQLVDEHQQAGYYELAWDGRDASGARVATGVYLYELRTGDCAGCSALNKVVPTAERWQTLPRNPYRSLPMSIRPFPLRSLPNHEPKNGE